MIRTFPKNLEAKILEDKLMRNRRVLVFFIGLEILLLNMASNKAWLLSVVKLNY